MSPEKLADLLDTIQKSPEPLRDLLSRFRIPTSSSRGTSALRFSPPSSTEWKSRKRAIRGPLEAVLGADERGAAEWSSRLTELRRALESPRMRAFRRFLNVSGGLEFLLELRADILAAERHDGLDLGPLDEETAHLFDSWFQLGFLFLQEITQDSPYRQIRFLKEHDMVHPMASLEEMGSRLGADRRCFALYHRVMPEEPIVFIEVALTRRLPRSIHEILEPRDQVDEGEPDTAIFYSINNAQQGLSGLGLGKLLIFQVVDAIKHDCPLIQTFATLSPVPGFWRRYLEPILVGTDAAAPFAATRDEVLALFQSVSRRNILTRLGAQHEDFAVALRAVLASPDWIDDPVYRTELEKPLVSIAFRYLTRERDAMGKRLNPVAGFHLGNGARLSAKNVLFGANRTERGLRDSCGIMVSYVYSSTWLHDLRRTARSMLPWQA